MKLIFKHTDKCVYIVVKNLKIFFIILFIIISHNDNKTNMIDRLDIYYTK